MTIREMTEKDWSRVAEIFTEALEKGKSTFKTQCPTYSEWDSNHLKDCRLVADENGKVIGWASISSISTTPAYWGVAEVSVYVDSAFQGMGIGTALLGSLCTLSQEKGYWCLYSSIFSKNEISINMHKMCGFREIGYREKPAKDKFGEWQDTVLMERRNKIL